MSATSEPFLWVTDTQAPAGQGLLSAAVAHCCRYLLPPGAHVGQLLSLVFDKCLRPSHILDHTDLIHLFKSFFKLSAFSEERMAIVGSGL